MSTPEQVAVGPCTPWVTAEDVAAVCPALDSSAEPAVYDQAALEASQVLYALSGRQFSGECGPVTVRPCAAFTCAPADPCGCCRTSRVLLAGSVREIHEVTIDGEAVPAAEYRVDRRRWLVRLADADGARQRWPACQRMDLDDTEEGTFAVTYTFGVDVPLAGQKAAVELACQLAGFGVTGECDLPAGTVRRVRQGITIDLDNVKGAWWLALPLTSLFLNAYNPAGLTRRAAIWSPDLPTFAQRAG